MRTILRPEFGEFLPEKLTEGVLYISIPYATTAHACACGCGQQVVAPLSPTDWRLIFDGETVSLEPSIGNWSFPCQSHYWIEHNRVRQTGRWSKAEIARGRERDRIRKAHRHGEAPADTVPPFSEPACDAGVKRAGRVRSLFWRWRAEDR